MPAVPPAVESPDSATIPRLLWDLPSRPRVFFSNLRELIFPGRAEPLRLESAPADFWADVFVKHSLPWNRFFQSGVYHVILGALVVGLAHLLALQPRVAPLATFDHSQLVYYQPSEYLPPLDTRDEPSARPRKADPEFSRQPIISVPREADNGRQTIVTPPKVKLKRDVAMPNIVAWSNSAPKPRLEIPPAPVTPAAEITRLAPKLEASVAPPPHEAHLTGRPNSPTLQAAVAAPPTDVNDAMVRGAFPGLQPALVAPPSDISSTPRRSLGDMNIAPSSVVAPAPQLPVAAQRSLPAGGLNPGPRVAPPPPSLAGSGSGGGSTGSRGQVIALNLRPAVVATADPPAGNRRGSFAATPEGHLGATGAPGATAGAGSGSSSNGGSGNGSGSQRRGSGEIPRGLYVGTRAEPPSPVAGDPGKAPTNLAHPDLVASVHSPRAAAAHAEQPENAAKLTEPERAVFGDRKFYSVMVNTPNLNSSGGSWVIRFAELSSDSRPHDEDAPAANLSQPMATRTVDPAYPEQLMRQNVAGTVILYAVIHADGSVGEVRVLRSVDERLDRFAKAAVAQWKFEPATKDGSPVDVEATFKIPFRPSHVGTNF